MSLSTGEASPWIRRFDPDFDKPVRLACFPHAGGSASYFFGLAKALAPVDVVAIQYPGRQDRRREPLIDNVPQLAEGIAAALGATEDSRPTAFFGHSLGAVLAFEVAARLERRAGSTLVRLFASGRRAPSKRRVEWAHLADDDYFTAELRRLGGTDELFLADEELRASVLRVARNDYKAVETYAWAPGSPLACPITVLTGNTDPEVTFDEAHAWELHTSAAFELQTFQGGHFFLESHWDEVASLILANLGMQADAVSMSGGEGVDS